MKNKKMEAKLTLTVGIPTCYGGKSLAKTADSIRKSKGGENANIIICADRTPLTKDVLSSLKKLGVTVIWNKKEGSQVKKMAQIVKLVNSDIFVSTQDDITFDKDTISNIVEEFQQNTNMTMLGIRILPLSPENKTQAALATMVRAVDTIGRNWNKGDNHLMASGRCLAYRTKFLKKFRMPHELINNDMFYYLENKRLNGAFKCSQNAKVYINCPATLKEQTSTSSRYQYSNEELTDYFNFDIQKEYQIPLKYLFKGFINEFVNFPADVLYYIYIYIYTRFKKQPKKIASNTKWNIELSTKK